MEGTLRGGETRGVCVKLGPTAEVRGQCPACGRPVVSNAYRMGDTYILRWECVGTLEKPAVCGFRKVL